MVSKYIFVKKWEIGGELFILRLVAIVMFPLLGRWRWHIPALAVQGGHMAIGLFLMRGDIPHQNRTGNINKLSVRAGAEKLVRIFIACAVLVITLPGAANSLCLSYNQRIFITGRLTREVAPGPPNYESIARGDRPEIFYALSLAGPVCVDADPTDPGNVAVPDVQKIQLVLSQSDYLKLENEIGHELRLSGLLMLAETGHHHTPVLLSAVNWGE